MACSKFEYPPPLHPGVHRMFMPVGSVLRLEEYRDRRSTRLRLAQALHRADPRRHVVFDHLVEIAWLTGADRSAAVWVDEHGSGQIHPYVVVDQLCDSPRRAFAQEPLRGAWQLGVPSAFDRPATTSSAVPTTFAVALGSDGTRAWFVVADSLTPRQAVSNEVRERLMFLSGECAAVVLHRDLDDAVGANPSEVGGTRFAGWDILADLDGRESDEVESRRIARRFVVVRLVRLLVDDDLTVSAERMVEQVRRARAEISDESDTGTERRLWEQTLDALADARLDDLATTLVDLGDTVEGQGHPNGAIEIYKCAYHIASTIGAARAAVDAARLAGRQERRRAQWKEADRWFQITHDVAVQAGFDDAAARALVGLAGVRKETGNLPAARSGFAEALDIAQRSGDRETIALVHHGLLGVEQAAGNLARGLEHGWIAVATYESAVGRTRCMASLAGALMEFGDRDAAEDAWTLVAASSDEHYYRVYAFDALGHLAALKGDAAAFALYSSQCDALGWEAQASSATAEVLYYRGLSYRALGQVGRATEWLTRAVTFAEDHGYNRILFAAEKALGSLEVIEYQTPQPAAPQGIREGLRTMRRELAGAGV